MLSRDADGRDAEATANQPTESATNLLVPEVKGRGRAGNEGPREGQSSKDRQEAVSKNHACLNFAHQQFWQESMLRRRMRK